MFVFVMAGAAMVLFALAGLNVRGPRFAPEWWGLACVTAALFAEVLARGLM